MTEPTGGAHLDTTELIAARDGTVEVAAREHLASCARCRAELETAHQVRARLRALPVAAPPRDRWSGIRGGILATRRRQRRGRTLQGLLAAAVLLVVAWAGLQLSRESVRQRETGLLRAQLTELREQSQLLDAELRALSARPTSSLQAEALLLLEDGLQQIDDQLARSGPAAETPFYETVGLADQLALWSSRLELQSAMVHVRHTPLRAGAL